MLNTGANFPSNVSPSNLPVVTFKAIDKATNLPCFLVGDGYPDFASQRVQMRVTSITCGEHTQKIVGALVDDDGIMGVNAQLNSGASPYLTVQNHKMYTVLVLKSTI